MKTVFLDFDGVLFDSAKEAYLLARYVYDGILPFSRVDKNDFAKYMCKRYLIVNSWQYYYLMKLLHSQTINDINEFEQKYFRLIQNRDESADKDFDIKFQDMREILINEHYDFWRKLETPFPFFYKIKNLGIKENLFIVSTKNKEAIRRKCMEYGFELTPENIFGKEVLKDYESKQNFLREFMHKNKIEKAIFVEDNEKTLNSCKNIKNLELCLAKWGYVSPAAKGLSEDEIIKAIKGE